MRRSAVPARLDGIVDSHCHLQHAAFDADRDAVIERARAAGVSRLLVPGWDVASSRDAVTLAARHPDFIDAAVGIHPHYAGGVVEGDWAEIEQLAGAPGVVAIGEIGLDHFRNLSPPAAQADAFGRQLALAERAGLPVVVHDREAHTDISGALLGRRGGGRAVRGVLHCFSGDAAMAQAHAEAGYAVSFALPVSFSSARAQREAAAALPASALLVETDSPWLGAGANRRNEPTTVLRVAAELARLRAVPIEEIARAAARAYDRLVSH